MRADPSGPREAASMPDEPLAITCPRCGADTTARFYGPCETCRDTLRATVGGEAHEVETAAYEPKMNVTPNAVAVKD
jgi:ribosomal protein S27E